MAAQHDQVFFPSSYQELFSSWARFPDALPFAGGTAFIRDHEKQVLKLPKNILSLDKIDELQRITRTERYLEIGAMVKIKDVIELGKIVPEALRRCLEGTGNPQLRSLATIGGNICVPERRLNASAALIALDAMYELRSAANTRWISASRLSSVPGKLAINPQELLTRIRLPLEQWDYTVYRKFGDARNTGGVAVFLMKNQKNVLSDMRIVFSGVGIVRDKNSETLLIGKQLPLNRRDTQDFADHWKIFLAALESPDPFTRTEIQNFIESIIFNLAD